MENKIHVLPTDKPSRLYIGDNLNFVFGMIQTSVRSKNDSFTNQHIYITSDSKFVRDEYITDGIEVIKATPKLVDAQGLVDRRDWNKIILTTDELYIHNDLIPKEYNLFPQYIQKIDDEFLEWFVKNPSCEEVEVLRCPIEGLYTIDLRKLIPKEEPKQELERGITITHIGKQETLEEVAERCFEEMKVLNPKGGIKEIIRMAVNFSAKWQQEQEKNKYSEEEVIDILVEFSAELKIISNITKWFEQFKKNKKWKKNLYLTNKH